MSKYKKQLRQIWAFLNDPVTRWVIAALLIVYLLIRWGFFGAIYASILAIVHWVVGLQADTMIGLSGLIIALCAFWITVVEHRRSNSPQIKIVRFQASYCTSVNDNNQKPFMFLRIAIKNVGLPLVDPKLCVSFQHPQFGWWQTYLDKTKKDDGGMWERGMIAEYEIKSYKWDVRGLQDFSELLDVRKQKAAIQLTSQGYVAYHYRVYRWWRYWWVKWWNSFAWTMNERLQRHITLPDGTKAVTGHWFRRREDIPFRLLDFAKNAKKYPKADQPPPMSGSFFQSPEAR